MPRRTCWELTDFLKVPLKRLPPRIPSSNANGVALPRQLPRDGLKRKAHARRHARLARHKKEQKEHFTFQSTLYRGVARFVIWEQKQTFKFWTFIYTGGGNRDAGLG